MAKKFLTSLKLVNLSSDPSVGSEGELYFNSSASVAKIYKQGAWSELGAGGGSETTVSTTEPVSPAIGDAWYKNDTGEFYIYDGTYWVEVNGTISLTQEQVQDYVAPMFTGATNTNVIATYDDANNVINLNTSGSITNIDSISSPDFIQFDTTANATPVTGLLGWDSVEGTLNLGLSSNKHIHVGEESVYRVRNSTGSTISKGTALYASGVEPSGRIQVTPYVADGSVREVRFMGLATENISNGINGFVQHFGYVRDLDTRGTSSTAISVGDETWAAGDILYVHPTVPGKLTNIKPTHAVVVAIIIIRHQTTGILFVRPSSGGHLEDIHDILISGSVQNNELLSYDLSNGVWTNKTSVEAGLINTSASVQTKTGDLILGGDLTVVNSIETPSVINNNQFQINVSASAGLSGEIDLMTTFAEINVNTDGSIDIRPGDVSGLNMYKFTKTYLQFPDTTQQNTAFLGMTNYDTNDLDEGVTNLYFTNQRAIDALASTLSSYLTNSSASTIYQPLDSDLTAIAAISGSSGFLKTNGSGSWSVDSNTYITSESDPVFTASDAFSITSASISAWNTSYGWGNHATAGYSLTSHNHSIDSLSNVVITGTPTDGQALVWDTSTSKWVNETVSGGASYPDQTGNDGKFLQTNSGSVSWQNVSFAGYLTESSASSTYLTQASASSTYQPIGSYLTTESDTFETVTDRGASSTNAITISNTTQATSATTGALIVSGGVGVAKDLWIDGNLHVAGTTTTENTKTVATHDNLIYLNAALDSTITNAVFASGSITYTAENLYTAGMDIRITGIDPSGFNISTGDNLTVASATPTYFIVVKSDPGASYVSGGTAHAKEESNPDLGFAGGYYDSGYAHAGLFRDSSDGIFKVFDGYTPEPDEAVNIDTGHVSFSFAPMKVEYLDVVNSSTTRTNLGLGTMAVETASNYLTTSSASSTYATIASPTFTGTVSIPTLNLTNALAYSYGGTGLTTLGTAGQVLTVNAGATAIEWATPSGGGGGGLTTTTTSISTNSATAIESFAIATSRTAEALIQITQGTDYYSSKVLLIHDGTTVKMTEYAILESTTGAIPLIISAAISGSNLELLATITDAATTNATAKVVLIEVAV